DDGGLGIPRVAVAAAVARPREPETLAASEERAGHAVARPSRVRRLAVRDPEVGEEAHVVGARRRVARHEEAGELVALEAHLTEGVGLAAEEDGSRRHVDEALPDLVVGVERDAELVRLVASHAERDARRAVALVLDDDEVAPRVELALDGRDSELLRRERL